MLNDGQYKHTTISRTVHKCFFCMKDKINCGGFKVNEDPKHSPEYRLLYNQVFVICPECNNRGADYIKTHLEQWVQVEKMLKGLK